MTNNCFKADKAKHAKRITEGELWDLVEALRDNVNNIGVLDGVMDFDLTEYSSPAIYDAVNKENRNDWILVAIYSNGK